MSLASPLCARCTLTARLLTSAASAVAVITALMLSSCSPRQPDMAHTTELADGWYLQASAQCSATPERISAPGFDVSGWYATEVPSTVLAALVGAGEYPDPYTGKNLELIPVERFSGSWWYRTTFELDELPQDGNLRLLLDGINYRADVWLNGSQVGSHDDIAGAFRTFDLDVTRQVRVGGNVLAIEVLPPRPGEPSIGFVDWNPTPPDRNMGLWRGVRLRRTGPVSVNHVVVCSDVDLETLASAELSIEAMLINHSDRRVEGSLDMKIDGGPTFSQAYSLEPGQQRQLSISPAEQPQLRLENPRLWWPHTMGEPHLSALELVAKASGEVTDSTTLSFGVREVEDYLTAEGHRGYRVNGKEVLLRGAGWVDDMLLADSKQKIEDQLSYVRHLRLNTIRLEGFWGSSQHLYDLADRYGILLMAGWSCQWEWQEYLGKPVDEEYGGITSSQDMELVVQSLHDQVLWLRNHPSIFVWVLASDLLPKPELERRYRATLAAVDPGRPVLASCGWRTSEVSGPSGAKMNGPYDYVTPSYWYLDKKRGGAFGFNTETGPGPQPPPLESLRRMLPEQHLWPVDEMWEYHCGRNEFNSLDRYLHAFTQRYGPSGDAEQLAFRAQAASYEAMRAMFEAFAVNRPHTTGIIQWMLNSAWPEMYWQLYDHYLMPNGAFYATRTACQPLSLVYHYGEHAVYGVNSGVSDAGGLQAEVQVLGLDGRRVLHETIAADLPSDGSVRLLDLTKADLPSPVYFLDLRLHSADGGTAGRNFYWLSTTPDVLDEAGATWYYTPNSSYADLTALAELPQLEVEAEHRLAERDGRQLVEVTLHNPGEALAFFIELQLLDPETGDSILPVLWDDNYLSLLPGETRTVSATVSATVSNTVRPRLELRGWNVQPSESVERGP